MEWFCGNQDIQREDFTSLSVLAIGLIFGLGGLVICVTLVLETVVSLVQLQCRRGLYHQVRWRLDSVLQLQHMAFEEAGLGTWKGGADEIAVTEKVEKFGPVTEWDEWHASIRGKAVGK